MKAKHLFWMIIGLVILLLTTVLSPAWSPGLIENELHGASTLDDETRDWLRAEMRSRGIPGLSLAVVIDGEVAAVEAFGVSDYWNRTPLTSDTLMEVASNSKVVTALAAVREVRAGDLSLDQPLADYRTDFSLQGEYADRITLEMLLTHTAGLGNALGQVPSADRLPEARFQYSGVGFELAGDLIAHNAGTELPEALRSSVLTPLGISEQATYSHVGDGTMLASPHVSITLPLLLFLLVCGVAFTLLILIAWLAAKLKLLKRWPDSLPLWILATSVALSLLPPFLLMSMGNAIRFAVVDLLFVIALVLLVGTIRKWWHTRSIGLAISSAILMLALVIPVFWHVPVPLEERAAMFPAAAGLRASARDMGRLLAALVNPPEGWEEDIQEVTKPRVRADDENRWGLGIGIQELQGKTVIWHWGVNYPGYQSLMLGIPESGDGLVVLMNGGPMTITLDGPRFSGLELARELAARVLPGPHGAYWHGVQ